VAAALRMTLQEFRFAAQAYGMTNSQGHTPRAPGMSVAAVACQHGLAKPLSHLVCHITPIRAFTRYIILLAATSRPLLPSGRWEAGDCQEPSRG
jgi:hypothetical protein